MRCESRPQAPSDRDGVIRSLLAARIGTSVHFKPLHRFRYYRDRYDLQDRDFPAASDFADRTLSLPLYPSLTEADQVDVAQALRGALAMRRRRRAPHTAYPASRRAFDICLTLALLPAALVLGLLVAVAVLIDSPGPLFYRSWRVGRDGKAFAMLKFRTMRHQAEGPSISARHDERLTPLGRLLASTRLDELPQLWNVLKGEMRLVGPRPELEEFVRDHEASYQQILSIPPGLTGPTQLAYADEGALLASAADRELAYRSQILPAKVQLDLAYVRSNSLLGDLSVIARTCLLPAVKLGYRLQGVGGWGDPRVAVALAVVASMAVAALFGLFALEAGRDF